MTPIEARAAGVVFATTYPHRIVIHEEQRAKALSSVAPHAPLGESRHARRRQFGHERWMLRMGSERLGERHAAPRSMTEVSPCQDHGRWGMLRESSRRVPSMSRLFALLLVLIAAVPASAWHRKTPTLLQITPNVAGTITNPRWSGYRYVVFDSDADLLGNGSTGRQVFLFDLQERDRTGSLAVKQVTSGAGSSSHGSTGTRAKAVAFDANPGGVGPRQIMVAPRDGTPAAITRGGADSINPVMDDSGRYVVFESQADLLGAGFGGSQIYLADLRLASTLCPYPCAASANAGLRQLTHKNGTSTHAVVNKGGKVVAFESNADLLNAGQNETQIYRVDVTNGVTMRLTHGPGASRHPTLAKSGKLIAFQSDADLLGNGSTGTQIFLHKLSTNTIDQVTAKPGGSSTSPSLESTGRGVIFVSSDDLLGNGSTGPQVYEFGIISGLLRQVTDASDTTSDPAYSAGVFTIFVSNADLLGNGTSGQGLYLVNLFALQSGVVP
jgi:Tol biopolymer transport system component